MARWLKSLQKQSIYDAAKNLIVGWSLVCAFSVIIALSKTLDMSNPVIRDFAKVITMDFWATVWAYPVAGLGIIAFVTRPRGAAGRERPVRGGALV